ncbi:outer membrane protein assembly factor BamD [Aquabacterium parvum]|uniref:outer membrane protein assembly factor BamD n=1 Tax=Aquabacterium parvum TaxID=70584 RepID=UPI000718EA8E|nr:outer membrane protein assembly factor BamD [Aquabacterium parvum]MBU0918127.1 outer membrane protein assembly factor BamD [Gammaproteobacteria bacterium]
MTESSRGLLAAFLAMCMSVMLVACGSTPQDEFANIASDKLYADAKDDAAEGNFELAIKKLEKVEARASGTLLSQQAQIDLAYAYFRTGEKAQALAKLERFIRLHPTSPALDYAFYLQGLVNFNENLGLFGKLSRQDLAERDQQASRDAYESFKQVVERFPQSRYAEDARLRMNHVVNSLAAGEVHVARYYLRRGAYLAAANRAQQAVKEYSQSPAVEEGLFIMAQAYDKLGLVPLRDDTLRVLRQSFPNSEFLSAGMAGGITSDKSKKPWWQLW